MQPCPAPPAVTKCYSDRWVSARPREKKQNGRRGNGTHGHIVRTWRLRGAANSLGTDVAQRSSMACPGPPLLSPSSPVAVMGNPKCSLSSTAPASTNSILHQRTLSVNKTARARGFVVETGRPCDKTAHCPRPRSSWQQIVPPLQASSRRLHHNIQGPGHVVKSTPSHPMPSHEMQSLSQQAVNQHSKAAPLAGMDEWLSCQLG